MNTKGNVDECVQSPQRIILILEGRKGTRLDRGIYSHFATGRYGHWSYSSATSSTDQSAMTGGGPSWVGSYESALGTVAFPCEKDVILCLKLVSRGALVAGVAKFLEASMCPLPLQQTRFSICLRFSFVALNSCWCRSHNFASLTRWHQRPLHP